MAKYDERGVIIPAPLQGSAAALAGKRYGDKHRGPAVIGSYELWHCWIDLAEHSAKWPCPDDLPAGMVEFSQSIPEEQRADWLRRQANLEDVDRRISYAIRSGDLPIWVAPQGEPEQLVATGALATIDQRSIKGGVFCPLSEEYKSEDDRPWLWERPLFVKWDDWVRFVAEVQSEKADAVKHRYVNQTEAAGANDDDLNDAGWLKGLPAGWIDGFICARRLSRRLKAEYGDGDPAPWHEVINADYWGPYFGDPPEDYAAKQKLSVRIVATMQRAALSGQVTPLWFDGSNFREIPALAFCNTGAFHNALLHGTFEIDPLWADEWQLWNGQGWAISKEQFEAWLGSPEAMRMDGLPPDLSAPDSPVNFEISSREPSDAGRVSLAEAVSWVAFGMALNADRLMQAITWNRLCGGELQEAQRRLGNAAAEILKAGSDNRISFYGRHIDAYDDKGKKTEKIDALTLDDYRQVLITGHDHLYYGDGLKRWYEAPNNSRLHDSDRSDLYSNVTVDRGELLKAFPTQDGEAKAFFAPIPASLPDIGLVMPLDEALSWLAVGRPSADLQVWENRAGELSFRDHNGVELRKQPDGSHPQFLDAFLQASRAMHSALRDGSLLSYVAPDNGQPLQVPRFYWNGVNPESLHHTYRGMSPGDNGAGCPVLFSRLAFDQWRAAIAAIPIASIDRAPSVKGGRPPSDDEILAKADEMKARGLDGRTIAKSMRLEQGFEHVATTTVRALIKGRWKPAGRPKKAA
ncbi:hypothetical protein ACLIMP_06270 [Novosphingobium aerophilum]|uniref:hypothetical protein n=1 Tax=Novosphingobium aerophilum TaxID=2839843 RepID=UPI003FCF9845